MKSLIDIRNSLNGAGTPLLSVNDLSSPEAEDEFAIKLSKELEDRKGYEGYRILATTPNGDREAFVFAQDLESFKSQIASNPALKLKPISPGGTGKALFKRRKTGIDLCKCSFAVSD